MTNRRSPFRIAVLVSVFAAGAWLSGMELFARADTDAQTAPAAQKTTERSTQKSGEQVFMQNCARCHKPPMAISPRTTGTIVMHMRVRAKLSSEDEKALLRYLAP